MLRALPLTLALIFVIVPNVEPLPAFKCGDHIAATNTGAVSLSTFPANLSNCILTINSTSGKLFLDISSFDVPEGFNLTIYQGNKSSIISTLHNLFGRSTSVFASFSNLTLVELASTAENVTRPITFMFLYRSKDCKRSLKEPPLTFASPVYVPGKSNFSFTCDYYLDVHLTQRIHLLWIKFALKAGVVTIFDGNSIQSSILAEYSGAVNTTKEELSSNSTVLIRMVLYTAVKQHALLASFLATSAACSHRISLDQTVNILSPNFPLLYHANSDCLWQVTVPEKKTIQLIVNAYDLADRFDIVRISDGDGLESGRDLDQNIKNGSVMLSTTHTLWIQLSTDAVHQARGFNFTLIGAEFGGALYDKGSLQLPTDPSKKTKATEFYYLLCSSSGQQVILKVDIAKTCLLPAGYVEFFDGSFTGQLIDVFRTDKLFYEIFSNAACLAVKINNFTINDRSTCQNLAHFSTMKTDEYLKNLIVTDLESLSLPLTSKKASWFIRQPNDSLPILLQVSHLDVNAILSLGNFTAKLPMQVINSSQVPVSLVIPGRYARINFTRNSSEDVASLIASVAPMPTCQQKILNASQGFLVSPLYPQRYPINVNCRWHFPARSNQNLHLYFEDFTLSKLDHLNITTSRRVKNESLINVASLSGLDGKPDDWLIGGSNVTIAFHSAGMAGGFKIHFEYLGCGSVENSSFAVKSPKLIESNAMKCVWLLKPTDPAEMNHNRTNYNVYTVEFKGNTNLTSVVVRDGARSDSPEIPLEISKKMSSRSNSLFVQYEYAPTAKAMEEPPQLTLDNTVTDCNIKEMCNATGICLHPEWKCNGINDCGDGTDEIGCIPPTHGGVSHSLLGWGVALSLVFGIIIGLAAPLILKRCRHGFSNYSRLQDLLHPIST